MIKIPPPIIPKEHGAWAMLFVPMLTVLLVTGTVTFNVLLLLLSSFFVFCSYVPMHSLLRNLNSKSPQTEKLHQAKIWTGIYLLIGMGCSIPLLIQGYYLLIIIGGIGAASFVANYYLTRKVPRTIPGDLVSVIGLTMTAPAAYYVSTKTADEAGVSLWLINLIFFSGTVLYVHMKIHASAMKKIDFSVSEKIRVGGMTVLYHVFVIAMVIIFAAYHYTSFMMICVFIPITIHVLYGTWKLSGRVRFKNLGLLLLGQSILFGILVGVVK